MAKVKIVSGGDVASTHVFSPDGEEIPGVTAISWRVKVGGKATAMMTFVDVEIDAVAVDASTDGQSSDPHGRA